jgi:hypothetical protein
MGPEFVVVGAVLAVMLDELLGGKGPTSKQLTILMGCTRCRGASEGDTTARRGP